jgi:salicylate biosynthesis isochorismate synthase/menaquinone-specific isochorismate synthase
MYSGNALEDNPAVASFAAKPPFVGLARPGAPGALLRLGPGELSVCWANPSRGVHVAGLGVAGEGGGDVTWLGPPPPHPPPGPWFGGWAFDAARPWAGFDAERWVLPEVLAWWDGQRPWVAAFGPAGTTPAALEARLEAIEEVEPQVERVPARATARSRAAWDALVDASLAALRAGGLEKLVAARVIDVEAAAPIPLRAVMKSLEARHPQCWSFLVRGRDGRAFVGASPELLCEVAGDELRTDALAGTSAGGQGQALLGSEKDLREHAAVVEGIRESLGPFVRELTYAPSPGLKVLSNLEHLHTPMRAVLNAGARPLEVARALHPTPAVAGKPRAAALGWLREHEGFARGWYAGAVGALGPAGLTLAVALRSALIDGARAEVFVGAGVVAGSTAESEWQETARKAQAVLPALGVEG